MTPADASSSRGEGPSSEARAGAGVDPASVLVVVGIGSVVLGGVVAAVTGPLELAHGSWLAAYLVLVSGVGQWGMGHARLRYPDPAPGPSRGWVQVTCWNLGNVAVMGATLAGQPLLVDLGSVLLVVALVVAIDAARTKGRATMTQVSPLFGWAYRTLLLVLAVSIPVGMVLSHVRHS